MEKGTSIFRKRKEYLAYLNKLVNITKKDFKVRLWFAEILGKRWSYLTGEREFFDYSTEKIQITETLGMVINDWGKVTKEKKESFISLIKEKINQEGES
ncbi:MAG: hypothetical protein NC818_03960 [Candidatus Omnitrophica bacterium]|nr:hypothetical protein [Candidatus Omnitrophota bacterium]